MKLFPDLVPACGQVYSPTCGQLSTDVNRSASKNAQKPFENRATVTESQYQERHNRLQTSNSGSLAPLPAAKLSSSSSATRQQTASVEHHRLCQWLPIWQATEVKSEIQHGQTQYARCRLSACVSKRASGGQHPVCVLGPLAVAPLAVLWQSALLCLDAAYALVHTLRVCLVCSRDADRHAVKRTP